MSNIKLSICIPTYNFGAFIGETLQSIVDQPNDAVEIVIVDGASTDNTSEIIRHFERLFPRLTYHRLEKKGGVDKDLARTVELARGEYCWLLSSDDVLKQGAIQKVLHEIERGNDVYVCNRIECDRALNPLRDRPWLAKNIIDRTFAFSNSGEFIDYFNNSQSIGALFSYISALIVKRSKWNGIAYDEKFTGSNYAHAARLFSILQQGGVLKYLREPLVFCRGDNDSFSEQGVVRRFLIDLDGYLLLADTLFPNGDVRRAFLSVMRREHGWYVFAELRSKIDDTEQWNDFERKLIEYGYARDKLSIVRTLGSFKYIMMAARALWTALKRLKELKARIVRKIYK